VKLSRQLLAQRRQIGGVTQGDGAFGKMHDIAAFQRIAQFMARNAVKMLLGDGHEHFTKLA
jgi:hypothetical protein